jgi:hypothetical protein
VWDFVASSDQAVGFALYSSLVAGAMTVSLFVWVVILRLRLLARERRRKAFIAQWRPLLTRIALAPASAEEEYDQESVPELPRRSLMDFLNEWNVLHDILRGSAGLRLNALARRMGVDAAAWRLLNHGRLSDQLIAIATLGHLGEVGAWDRLCKLLHSDHTLISLMSAKALINIDADRGVPLVLPLVTRREDWAAARVSSLLREAGPAATSKPLQQAILEGTPEEAAKLIGFLPTVHRSIAGKVVHEMLQRSVDDRVTSVCLRVADSPLELPQVRHLVNHPRWHIRMRAATVLGRIGYRQDKRLLERLLCDPEWWVRYRAAQALTGLPFMDKKELKRIRERLDDAFGRDMMDQVIAERAA